MQQKCYGEIYIKKHEFKKAIEVYTNSLKFHPENFETYYNLGICYARINDFDISRKCFQKAIELNENLYKAYFKLGQIALLYRDFDVAEENFIHSISNEKEAKAYFELAKIHIMKNQKNKAILDLNNLLRIDTEYYKKIQTEPVLFSIKQAIPRPEKEIIPKNKEETELEKETEDYLKDTYNLTKILNNKDNSNKNINTKKQNKM